MHFKFAVLPLQFVRSELHPAYIRLINTSVALLGQHQSGQTHLLGTVLCMVQWQRLLIPFTPFQLECCRVCGWKCSAWLIMSL